MEANILFFRIARIDGWKESNRSGNKPNCPSHCLRSPGDFCDTNILHCNSILFGNIAKFELFTKESDIEIQSNIMKRCPTFEIIYLSVLCVLLMYVRSFVTLREDRIWGMNNNKICTSWNRGDENKLFLGLVDHQYTPLLSLKPWVPGLLLLLDNLHFNL